MSKIKTIKISVGNYVHNEYFELFGFEDRIKCYYVSMDNIINETINYYLAQQEDKDKLLNFLKVNNYLDSSISSQKDNYSEGGLGFSFSILFDDNSSINKEYSEQDITEEVSTFYNIIKEIINNSETINLEKILIQISIYYILATSNDEDMIELSDCSKILEQELKNEDNTLFYFKGTEHILNSLAKNFNGIDKELYVKLIKNAIAKINYFNHIVREHHLRNVASENDVEQLTNEIINFSNGLEVLKNTSNTDVDAMYELGIRYYYSSLYDEAFSCFSNAASKNHRKAVFMKILCTYDGTGTEKNETSAFNELNKYIENNFYSKALELLGEMYYFGKGVEQNYNKAIELFKEIESEEYLAQYFLGLMYYNGYGIEKDINKGMEYIIKSASQRCKEAIDFMINNMKF